MKRVFLIHGWGGSPEKGWFPWLKNELEARGFQVFAPAMPDTDAPKIDAWVGYLEQIVVSPDGDTYFVGHSVGCQTIMRFLEKADAKVGGLIFVAGWVILSNMTLEEAPIAEPWINTPIDFNKVKKSTKNIIAIFSDNDEFVPPGNVDAFLDKLGARIVTQKGKGHFDDNMLELQVARDELLKITG